MKFSARLTLIVMLAVFVNGALAFSEPQYAKASSVLSPVVETMGVEIQNHTECEKKDFLKKHDSCAKHCLRSSTQNTVPATNTTKHDYDVSVSNQTDSFLNAYSRQTQTFFLEQNQHTKQTKDFLRSVFKRE